MGCNVYFDTKPGIAVSSPLLLFYYQLLTQNPGDTDTRITSSIPRVRFPFFGCIMQYNRIYCFLKEKVQGTLLLFLDP